MTNLDKWRRALQECESPNLFIDWSYYAIVSAALERRVAYCEWPTLAKPATIFSNEYIIFVGPPGAGKSMPASLAKGIFKPPGAFAKDAEHTRHIINLAPNSVSVQALWERMAARARIDQIKSDEFGEAFPPHMRAADGSFKSSVYTYLSTPVAVIADQELGSFLPEYSKDTVNFLQEAYVADDFEDLKISAGSRFLPKCCLTLFGCTNPEWIIEATRNKLLQQGLSARTIFVWAHEKRFRKPRFFMDAEAESCYNAIIDHITSLTKLFGKAVPTPEADAWFTDWYVNGGDARVNKSEKLIDYYTRKRVHLIKLAMLMHFAESTSMSIGIDDFKNALALLARTECTMHKALAGSGINPAYDVADKVIALLTQSNGDGVPALRLYNDVYALCPQGRATFDEAINFLRDTGQIDTYARESDSKQVYALTERMS